MSTLHTKLSDSLIKRTIQDKDSLVRDMSDPRYPVILRIWKNREKASWHYRHKGRWKKIGEWPRVTLKHVESNLPEIELALACGTPIERAVVSYWSTISQMLDWYLENVSAKPITKHRKTTIKSAIKCHIRPLLGHLAVETLTKAQLHESLILPLRKNQLSDSFIQLIFGVVKSAYHDASALELIPYNPVSGFKLEHFGKFSIKPKPSAIRTHQIKSVLSQIDGAKPQPRLLAIMMLLHGTRIGETRQATWDDIDFEGAMWRLPAHLTKSRAPLDMPLSGWALQELRDYRQWQSKRYSGKYIFHKSPRKPLTRTQANTLIKQVSGEKWTAHDLRKTVKNTVVELGVDKWVCDLLLNHTLTKLDKTYIQEIGDTRKRAAIVLWHEWLNTLKNDPLTSDDG